VYDLDFKQSGIIPFLISDGQLKYLLITSNRTGKWIFPKGMIEENMTPSESAANEGLEEAGVIGTVYDNIIYSYEYSWEGIVCKVDMFPFKIQQIKKDWEEPWRKRQLYTYDEALKSINEELIEVLKKGHEYIIREFKEELKNRE